MAESVNTFEKQSTSRGNYTEDVTYFTTVA
jgi:hypothetical protein